MLLGATVHSLALGLESAGGDTRSLCTSVRITMKTSDAMIAIDWPPLWFPHALGGKR